MTREGTAIHNSRERAAEADGSFARAMNQDVEFSPNLEEHIYVEAFSSVSRNTIHLERPVFNEETLARRFKPQIEEKLNFRKSIKTKLKTCHCSARETLLSLFPIARWLPKYNLKRNFIADFTGGLTVGIFHIPQGLGFAMLASLPPVTGLYTALLPVVLYMMMGTSRHLSQGSFAVICLMTAAVINREVQNMGVATTSAAPIDSSQGLVASPTVTASNLTLVGGGHWSPLDARKMGIAVTLTLVVGLIQVLMGVTRLGFAASYLSDPLISGFTTGAAVVVVISQVKLILQLPVPQGSGVFASGKTVFFMLKHLPQVNVGSLITGVLCLFIILSLKYINEKYKKKLKVPIPAELVVVVLGTAIGYGGELNKNFDVSILGEIQKGLPPLSVPTLGLVPNILVDSFVIAVVIFATNITLSKMFAKKNGYSIDSNQELIAYGASNIGGSFFSCFPICNALARSAVQENLANTQLCSLVVVVLIMFVLSFVAQLFYDLPKAILGAVVIANLVGLLKQFSRFVDLWKICKSDAVVWLCTCAGVVLLGVDLGLGFGVSVSLLCVIYQSSRPYFSLLGQLHRTEIYRDVHEFEESVEEPQGIKIFKFDSSLYFANVEHFRNALSKTTGIDPSKHTANSDRGVNMNRRSLDRNVERYLVNWEDEEELLVTKRDHAVIIDASSFTFIDSMGISALASIIQEHRKIGVNVYIAGCPLNTRKKLVQGGFHKAVGKNCLFATVHDAVSCATLVHKEWEESQETDL